MTLGYIQQKSKHLHPAPKQWVFKQRILDWEAENDKSPNPPLTLLSGSFLQSFWVTTVPPQDHFCQTSQSICAAKFFTIDTNRGKVPLNPQFKELAFLPSQLLFLVNIGTLSCYTCYLSAVLGVERRIIYFLLSFLSLEVCQNISRYYVPGDVFVGAGFYFGVSQLR